MIRAQLVVASLPIRFPSASSSHSIITTYIRNHSKQRSRWATARYAFSQSIWCLSLRVTAIVAVLVVPLKRLPTLISRRNPVAFDTLTIQFLLSLDCSNPVFITQWFWDCCGIATVPKMFDSHHHPIIFVSSCLLGAAPQEKGIKRRTHCLPRWHTNKQNMLPWNHLVILSMRYLSRSRDRGKWDRSGGLLNRYPGYKRNRITTMGHFQFASTPYPCTKMISSGTSCWDICSVALMLQGRIRNINLPRGFT